MKTDEEGYGVEVPSEEDIEAEKHLGRIRHRELDEAKFECFEALTVLLKHGTDLLIAIKEEYVKEAKDGNRKARR